MIQPKLALVPVIFLEIFLTPLWKDIRKIREVVEKDSTNVYAQMMLVKGSLMSGQYDKAINRLETIYRLQPDNLEAILLLADVYERTNDKCKCYKMVSKKPYASSKAEMSKQKLKSELKS